MKLLNKWLGCCGGNNGLPEMAEAMGSSNDEGERNPLPPNAGLTPADVYRLISIVLEHDNLLRACGTRIGARDTESEEGHMRKSGGWLH